MVTGRARRLADGLLELLYPRRAICMGCGSQAGFERDWLCEECRRELANRWIGAMTALEGGWIEGAVAAYLYGGPSAGLVRNLKYRGVRMLAEPMGRHMADAFEALQPAHIDAVVPVPMHAKRLKKRGYNHAGLLAREAARRMNLPLLDALDRTRDTPQQARLSDAERMKNLDGAFALREEVGGLRLLLVDDVCTTGATANACAATLLGGGAQAVLLLCFASAHGARPVKKKR